MTGTDPGPARWRARIALSDETAMRLFAAELATRLRAGDCIALAGPIGAGKTTLARALIQTLAGGEIEVPSPTFTLVQDYPELSPQIVHYDLYRLAGEDELAELGLDEALSAAAVLIEWPDRAGRLLPYDRLTITLSLANSGRDAQLSGPQSWGDRLSGLLEGRSMEEDSDN